MRHALWFMVSMVALASCGGMQLSRLPGQGGPRWRELASPHFVLWTDLSPGEARKTVRALEDYRALLVGVVLGDAPRVRNGRSLVVAVRSYDDWRVLGAPENLLGLTWSAANVTRQPVLAFVGEDERGFETERGRVIVHELAHLVLYSVLGAHPRWLGEGIATYFESARIDREAHSGKFGRFPFGFQRTILANGLQPFDKVVTDQVDGYSVMTYSFYNSSHILVSFLMNTRPAAFMTYQRRLTEVPPEQHTALWSEVFPDLPPQRLAAEVSAWMKGGSIREHHLRVALEEPAIAERELTDADVLATRALVGAAVMGGAMSVQRWQRVAQHADAALALDPVHPLAALLSATATGRADPERARAVTAAHPDDYRAWLLRVTATTGEAQQEAFARLCALVGDNPAIDVSRIGRCEELDRPSRPPEPRSGRSTL